MFNKNCGIAIIAFVLFIVQTSCSSIRQQLTPKASLCKLSNQVIINQVSEFNALAKREGRNLLVYIDADLVYRPVLLPIFPYQEKYALLFDAYPDSHCVLEIPDSLNTVCKRWVKGTDAALGDTVNILYHSSLLPTKQKKVYALQSYTFFSDSYNGSRLAFMDMDLFQIDRKKITTLKPLGKGENMAAWSNKDYPIKE